MVLVLNSPTKLWMIISWLIHIFYKSTTQRFLVTTRQTTTQALWLGQTGFKCISEYTCFMVFTIICTLIKIALQCAWLLITGLLWWYRFYKNIIDDPSGRSITDIFRSPHKGYPPPLFPLPNSRKRHPRPFRKRFPGISRTTPMPSCFIPINHRENKKKIAYLDIESTSVPLVKRINEMLHHIWNEHHNAEFYDSMHTILISLWFCIGFRMCKLTFVLIQQLHLTIAGWLY